MKLETIKRNNNKKIIIGSMIVLSVVGCLTLTTTRAKYRGVQSLKLANGIVDYKVPDLKLAIKVSEDGEKYTSQSEIPEGNYTLNIDKSKCRIPTSTLNGENAPIDEGITIEYVDGKLNFRGLTKNDTKCYIYFDKVLGQTSSTIIADIEKSPNFKSGTPDFTQVATGAETEANNGIYKVSDGMHGGYSYYWRGRADTNHVIFDSKCWRIVRINGDKSIRLIYNGTPSGNTCTQGANSNAVIMGSSNAEKYYATSDGKSNNPSYAGWTYTLNTQRTIGGTDSNIKTQTNKWYDNNIYAEAKENVDTNGKFCNDRNLENPPASWGLSSNDYTTSWTAWSSSTNKYIAYAASKRIYEDYKPTLSCPSGDVYTLNVGAITADEVMFAGGKEEYNTSYYLYTSTNYWTTSPRAWDGTNVNVFHVYSNGHLYGGGVRGTYGLRPVINLRSDVTFNVNSDGTYNNPYIVQ